MFCGVGLYDNNNHSDCHGNLPSAYDSLLYPLSALVTFTYLCLLVEIRSPIILDPTVTSWYGLPVLIQGLPKTPYYYSQIVTLLSICIFIFLLLYEVFFKVRNYVLFFFISQGTNRVSDTRRYSVYEFLIE